MGVRTLATWLRTMTEETGLGGEYYTNKTGRTTGLGRYIKFEPPLVPWFIWHVIIQSSVQIYALQSAMIIVSLLTCEGALSLGNIASVVKSVSGLFNFVLFLIDCSEGQTAEDCGIRCKLQLNM